MTAPTRTATADHAIVIGGSMAGLLTARVLSDHFARVTIVERDKAHNGRRRARANRTPALCTYYWGRAMR